MNLPIYFQNKIKVYFSELPPRPCLILSSPSDYITLQQFENLVPSGYELQLVSDLSSLSVVEVDHLVSSKRLIGTTSKQVIVFCHIEECNISLQAYFKTLWERSLKHFCIFLFQDLTWSPWLATCQHKIKVQIKLEGFDLQQEVLRATKRYPPLLAPSEISQLCKKVKTVQETRVIVSSLRHGQVPVIPTTDQRLNVSIFDSISFLFYKSHSTAWNDIESHFELHGWNRLLHILQKHPPEPSTSEKQKPNHLMERYKWLDAFSCFATLPLGIKEKYLPAFLADIASSPYTKKPKIELAKDKESWNVKRMLEHACKLLGHSHSIFELGQLLSSSSSSWASVEGSSSLNVVQRLQLKSTVDPLVWTDLITKLQKKLLF